MDACKGPNETYSDSTDAHPDADTDADAATFAAHAAAFATDAAAFATDAAADSAGATATLAAAFTSADSVFRLRHGRNVNHSHSNGNQQQVYGRQHGYLVENQ